jgi:hypothetical protein
MIIGSSKVVVEEFARQTMSPAWLMGVSAATGHAANGGYDSSEVENSPRQSGESGGAGREGD